MKAWQGLGGQFPEGGQWDVLGIVLGWSVGRASRSGQKQLLKTPHFRRIFGVTIRSSLEREEMSQYVRTAGLVLACRKGCHGGR